MSDVREFVAIAGVSLEVGESLYDDCPECGKPGKFSITRTDTGLLYHCFRDSCPAEGHVGAVGISQAPAKHKQKDTYKLNPYEGELEPLTRLQAARFLVVNGLGRRAMEHGRFKWAPEEDCYAFPIMDPRGYERGILLRRFDGRGAKALSRQHTEGARQSWYVHRDDFSRVVIVEDQISALKLSRYCTTVALLGTAMSHDGAMEIAHVRPNHVTIALDEDAINTAYKLKSWFGLLWPTTDVIHLRKDVKDMSYKQIEDMFGVSLDAK